MSNLNGLISKIIEDANIKADALIKEAEIEKSKIINIHRKNAEAKIDEIKQKTMEDLKIKRERKLSSAALEVRNNKLNAKQQIINKVFDRALERLLLLPDNEYLELVKKLILMNSITGEETMIIGSKDKGKITQSFIDEVNNLLISENKKGQIKLSEATRELEGGFILISSTVEINCTFKTLVYSLREEMEYKVAEVLFS